MHASLSLTQRIQLLKAARQQDSRPDFSCCMQTCNTTAFVVSNSFIVYGTCDWFTPFVYWCNFVQWTSWNMVSSPAISIFTALAHTTFATYCCDISPTQSRQSHALPKFCKPFLLLNCCWVAEVAQSLKGLVVLHFISARLAALMWHKASKISSVQGLLHC